MNTDNVLLYKDGDMDFGDRIRAKRVALDLSQGELAARLGISKNAVANWEAGRTRPDLAKVPELCRELQMTLPAFFGLPSEDRGVWEEYRSLEPRNREIINRMIRSLLDMQEVERPRPVLQDLRRVYLNSEKASAGTGNMLGDTNGEYVYVHLPRAQHRADEIITVTGNSMEPTFRSGDLILVEHTAQLRPGEIGVFTVDGQGFVKEFRENGLYSHNKAYAPILFSGGGEIRCVGRVLGQTDRTQFATAAETECMEEKRRSRRPIKGRVRT